MNYIYLAIGLVVGAVFLGMAKNTRRRKAIPYEVTKKLKSSRRMDEYNQWCDTEARADTIVGIGLIVFGFSVTFVDTNILVTNVLGIISLIVFVTGYIMRIVNNKKHLNHFFVR